MLLPGTQMHIVTFLFVCIEILVLFYLLIYRFARPDDTNTFLNIILIIVLITYNVTGGLLPDPNLPGSFFVQKSIAYATGFMTPCYFPYYVFRVFALEKMRFHAKVGVFLFLILPYVIFVVVFSISSDLNAAKDILILPVLYAIWVIYSLFKAVLFKYKNGFRTKESKEEIVVMFLSLTPWIGLPIIDYFDLGQAVEAITTNSGFLLMLALHLRRNVDQIKDNHQQLIESQKKLSSWEMLEQQSREQRFKENCEKYQLTAREKEIACLICKGLAHKEIGDQLFISDRTVAKHAQNIFEKVRVCNKMELCAKLEKVVNSA